MPKRHLAIVWILTSALSVGACGESRIQSDAGIDASAVVPWFIGGPCMEAANCLVDGGFDRDHVTCINIGAGYCSGSGCLDPGFLCPGASSCVPAGPRGPDGGSAGVCLNPCADVRDCRVGFECHEGVTGFRYCRAIRDDGGIDAGTDGG